MDSFCDTGTVLSWNSSQRSIASSSVKWRETMCRADVAALTAKGFGGQGGAARGGAVLRSDLVCCPEDKDDDDVVVVGTAATDVFTRYRGS